MRGRKQVPMLTAPPWHGGDERRDLRGGRRVRNLARVASRGFWRFWRLEPGDGQRVSRWRLITPPLPS